MVVLRPALKGERAKSCSCGHLGICSPIKERSSFYPRRSEGGYRSECRRCSWQHRALCGKAFTGTPISLQRLTCRACRREVKQLAAPS